MKKLSSQQSGTLGEFLAVAKLNTLGYAAYISPEGAPGHDVIVVVADEAKSIEVKTRQFLNRPSETTRWPVEMDTKGDADFFIFIELDLHAVANLLPVDERPGPRNLQTLYRWRQLHPTACQATGGRQ